MSVAASPRKCNCPNCCGSKRNQPDLWTRVGRAEDLADHIVSRIVGKPTRSLSTLATKWSFLPMLGGWDGGFLEAAGLSDLKDVAGLSTEPGMPGTVAGMIDGIAPANWALSEQTRVSFGIVDAFAGAISLQPAGWTEGARHSDRRHIELPDVRQRQTALHPRLLGTVRRCTEPAPGPLKAANRRPAPCSTMSCSRREKNRQILPPPTIAVTEAISRRLAIDPNWASFIHVLPDFHGNRSPYADPTMAGVIHGLELDCSQEALEKLYWRVDGRPSR